MTIIRDSFVVGINYNNKPFTPRQIAEYIENTSDEGYADSNELKSLINKSKSQFDELIRQYGCGMDDSIDASSDKGKKVATLALQHCDETIGLIVRGGWKRGAMI